MPKDVWRKYSIRKYVTARDAVEAIRLSDSLPVVEVIEMQDKPEPSNSETSTAAIGFQYVNADEAYEL